MLEVAIVREQEQPLTIPIQASHRIYILDRDVVLEGVNLAGELAQHTVGLIDENVARSGV